MKKLITLTALLLCAVVSSWAEEVKVGRTAAFSADTHANTLLPTSNSDLTVTIADGTQDMGASIPNKSTKEICYKSTDKVKIDAFLCYRTQIDDEGLGAFNENAYAGFKVVIADGKKLALSAINGKVATLDDETVCKIIVEDEAGNALQTSSDKTVNRNSGNDFTVSSTLQLTGTVYVKMHYWTKKLNKSVPHASKYMVPVELTIDGNLTALTEPNINSTPSSITLNATESGTPVNSSFTIKGSYLTPGNYNLTVPSVSGLSVSPTSFTVAADGTVNQVVNVSYSSTENVLEDIANITANVDGINLNVAVNYSASVTAWTLQTISSETTWDFSKITANTESDRYNSSDKAIKLSDETTPKSTDDVVYENYKDIDYTFADGFNGKTIAFQGQYPIRNKSYCQNGTIHFKTTEPGAITVTFSDTGSSVNSAATPRYLIVNSEQTPYWTSRPTSGSEKSNDKKTSGEIYVPAGDVYITGSQAICIYNITFKLLPLTTKVKLTSVGYRTFASEYPLDFTSGVDGLKAYKATVSGSTVAFSEVKGKVPAKEGLLLKAAGGEYTIPVSADEPAEFNNALVGVIKATDKAAGIYVLMDGAQGVGFYKTVNTFEVGDNTAYLPASVAGARQFIGFDEEGEATGIEAIERVQTTDTFFNLNGQRVAAPQKGLYILNGKKVIKK